MAEVSYPAASYNSGAVTDAEYEQLAARFSDNGLYGSPSDPPPVAAGAGLQVLVRAGLTGSLRARAWTSGPSDVPLTIAANSSGATRVDSVVLRLDRSTWLVRAAVRAGTPGAGEPTLVRQTGDTGLFEELMATVTVPNGATSVTVTPRPLYVGSRVRAATSSTLPPAAASGEITFEADTGRWTGWTGTTRKVLYDYTGPVAVPGTLAGWTEGATGHVIERSGLVVSLRLGTFQRTGGGLSAEFRLPGTIPADMAHPTHIQRVMGIASAQPAVITVFPANHPTRARQIWVTTGSIGNGSFVLGHNISWIVGA